MSCYNATERATANLIYPLFSNSSDTAVGLQWANGENLADLCYERLKDIGSYVGTAFVARDLINVAEALGEDGMLRYYGRLSLMLIRNALTCERRLLRHHPRGYSGSHVPR